MISKSNILIIIILGFAPLWIMQYICSSHISSLGDTLKTVKIHDLKSLQKEWKKPLITNIQVIDQKDLCSSLSNTEGS